MMPSWSSEICNSNSDTSMPRLSTSRILPIPSVRLLPGMNAPTGANTPFMPVRALGAPHTTWTGLPSPVSTMHTRSRSALGCGLASTTRAMTNGANSFALSSIRSTSSPIMVSLAAISSSERAVSRCSLSQANVSFIMGAALGTSPRSLPHKGGGSRVSSRHETFLSHEKCGPSSPSRQEVKPLHHPEGRRYSRAQPSGQRRPIERAEAVVRQPAHIGFEEGAQIGHAVFEHRYAVDAHAPGEALVLVRIEAAIAQHVRMHHAAAENFHPILAFAETDLALVATVLDVDFERRLGEREE